MKDKLYALLQLQKIDNEIARENAKRKRLPERIQEKERLIANFEKKYQQERNSLRELQLKIKRKEIDAKAINDKIEKNKNELYGGKISDIKELKQLQKVIESLQEERDKVEEDLLLLMDEEDSLRFKISSIEKDLSELKEQLKDTQQKIKLEDTTIEENIQKKEVERKEIIKKINDSSLIEKYLILWKEKRGEAIVEIESAICSGCNLSLPSDIIYHLQNDDYLIVCPNCNRILIWKETPYNE